VTYARQGKGWHVQLKQKSGSKSQRDRGQVTSSFFLSLWEICLQHLSVLAWAHPGGITLVVDHGVACIAFLLRI
jgi:hypothetical protein